jgi:hypothetical protein
METTKNELKQIYSDMVTTRYATCSGKYRRLRF